MYQQCFEQLNVDQHHAFTEKGKGGETNLHNCIGEKHRTHPDSANGPLAEAEAEAASQCFY